MCDHHLKYQYLIEKINKLFIQTKQYRETIISNAICIYILLLTVVCLSKVIIKNKSVN